MLFVDPTGYRVEIGGVYSYRNAKVVKAKKLWPTRGRAPSRVEQRKLDHDMTLAVAVMGGIVGAEAAIAAPTLLVTAPAGPNVAKEVADAAEKYPKLVKFGIQAHHEIPKYIGGAVDGVRRLIPAPYHQLITNAFRAEAKYGKGLIYSVDEIADICAKVYARYPIDSFPIAP